MESGDREERDQNRIEQKIQVYSDVLSRIAELSQSKTLKVGCMALKKDFSKIASFGYNGSYSGAPIQESTGGEEESLEPGKSGFIHAEVNMAIKFQERDPENYIVMLSHSPCKQCCKILINAGFKNIFWIDEYRETEHLKILNDVGILNGNMNDLKNQYKNL